MTTSGTYSYNPSLGEIVLYAYNNAGLRNTSLVQEHFETARMAANMLLSRWSNQGVNLWKVELVTVNLVQPGSIDTDMNPASGEQADQLRALTALGRYGKPEEIAAVVAFLASPSAALITGAMITADAGFSA